ncbi:MAG: TOBE domain-containing protein, partial [Kiritimatiellae bacterium]|nr:TOBE domain-containing protein [Kiritimatiellia bacterium]
PYGVIDAARVPAGLAAGDPVVLCVRPEAVSFGQPPAGGGNVIKGAFQESVYLGEVAQHTIALEAGGTSMSFKAFELNPAAGRERAGERVDVWVDPEQVIVTR